MPDRLTKQIIVPLMLFVVGIAFINAWIADDASVTLRTIFHLLNGYGPNFNADIRVQSYTHPLWMILLSLIIGITREYYFTTIAVSLACTVGALFLISRLAVAAHTVIIIAAFAILSLSKSFIEYSTSGLENPLGYLLLAALCVVIFYRDHITHPMRWIGILLAGIILNRQDYILLVAPLIFFTAFVWQENTSRTWLPNIAATTRNLIGMSVGLIPIILWFGFSTFYYGSPFPNTAYAKLNTFIDDREMIAQGILYILATIQSDPLVLGTVGMATLAAYHSRQRMALLLVAGIYLYGIYIVLIGGDFMIGRFFSGVVFLSVVAIIISNPQPTQFLWGLMGTLLFVGVFNPLNPWYTPINTARTEMYTHPSGVIDERHFYAKPRTASVALLNLSRYGILNPYAYINRSIAQIYEPRESENYINCDCTGTMGIALGPRAVLIDNYALFDPLIARLPALYDPYWRIGHFRRTIPIGYMESFQSGQNQIADPDIATLYDIFQRITQGPLWDTQRIALIYRLNTGQYDHLIDTFSYRFPDAVHINIAEAAYIKPQSPVRIGLGGLVVHLDQPSNQATLTIAHQSDISLKVLFYKGTQQIAVLPLLKQTMAPSIITSNLVLPESIRNSGYEKIHILIDHDYKYPDTPVLISTIGHILLQEHPDTNTLATSTLEFNSDKVQPAYVAVQLRWKADSSVVSQSDVVLTHNREIIQKISNQLIDNSSTFTTEVVLQAGFNYFAVVATSNNISIPAPEILNFTITPALNTADALDVNPHSLPIVLESGWYEQGAQWFVEQADFHTRWYRLPLDARGRWTQSPQFQVFAGVAGAHTLTLDVSQLVQPSGLATSAPFELVVNGQSQPVTLQMGGNQHAVSLQSGLNTIQLRATHPSQALATLFPGSNDARMVDIRITTLAVLPNSP